VVIVRNCSLVVNTPGLPCQLDIQSHGSMGACDYKEGRVLHCFLAYADDYCSMHRVSRGPDHMILSKIASLAFIYAISKQIKS